MQYTHSPITAVHPQAKRATVRYLWRLTRMEGITLDDLESEQASPLKHYDGLKHTAGAWKQIDVDPLGYQNLMRNELEPLHG